MQICKIEYARCSAVENMALDAAMLALADDRDQVFWRAYGWNEPAITFGYSQAWSWVHAEMTGFKGSCVRRMTGGGIVDHRNDLTYALAIPSSHALYREPATDLYKCLHQHIADILLDIGIEADLAPCRQDCGTAGTTGLAGICFQQPEPYDVVARLSGAKLAGAAMKRNQSGILIQGSLDKQHLPGLTSGVFEREFGLTLERWLGGDRQLFEGALPADQLAAYRRKFASREWNEKR